jgi:hypothetical protein
MRHAAFRTRILAFSILLTLSGVSADAAKHQISVIVADGTPVNGVAVVRAVRGDDIVLEVQSNRVDEVHLHGYDLHLALKPDRPAELRFKATMTGRFAAELHRAQTAVAIFEIYPK